MSKCVYDRFLCDAAGRRGIFRSVRFSTDVLAQGQGFPAFKRRSSKDVTCTTFGLKTSWARGHTHLIGQIAALRGRSGQGRHFQVSRFSADVLAQGTRLSCVQTPGSKDATDATCTPFGLKASWARGHTLKLGPIAALRGRSGQGRPRHSLWFRRQIGARASLVNMEQTPFLAAKMAV